MSVSNIRIAIGRDMPRYWRVIAFVWCHFRTCCKIMLYYAVNVAKIPKCWRHIGVFHLLLMWCFNSSRRGGDRNWWKVSGGGRTSTQCLISFLKYCTAWVWRATVGDEYSGVNSSNTPTDTKWFAPTRRMQHLVSFSSQTAV